MQGLGARAHRGLGPGGLAKGWESAETAAADVGAWREAGTGYRISRAGEKGRGFSPLLKPSNTPPKVGGFAGVSKIFSSVRLLIAKRKGEGVYVL